MLETMYSEPLEWMSEEILKERWFSLNSYQKLIELMLKLYFHVNGSDYAKAIWNFRRDKNYFFNVLDKDRCDQIIKQWQKIHEGYHFDQIKMGLIYLAVKIYLDKNKNVTYQEALKYGFFLIENEITDATKPKFLEELRIAKLKENLAWADLKKVSHLKNKPLKLLKMIILYNKHVFPKNSFLTNSKIDIKKFPENSVRSLDEAAILWHLLNNRQISDSINLIREAYFIPLASSCAHQGIIDQIIELFENSHNSTAIYFNGFVFKNAVGKTFKDLIELPKIQNVLNFLDASQKSYYLQKSLEEMGESVQYTIGTIWHSWASGIVKIFHYQYHRPPPFFENKYHLMEQFVKLQMKWEVDKNCPINPHLLVAMHLAETNGVVVNGTQPEERVRFLLNYLSDEFQKAIPELQEFYIPRFGEKKIAFFILKKLGLSDIEIAKKRYYKIEANEEYYQNGDAIDEFLAIEHINRINFKRKNWITSHTTHLPLLRHFFIYLTSPSLSPLLFSYKDKKVDPMLEMNKARADFRNHLLSDPWVEEDAKEKLEYTDPEVNEEALNKEIIALVERYQNVNADIIEHYQKDINATIYSLLSAPIHLIIDEINKPKNITKNNGDSKDTWKLFTLLGVLTLSFSVMQCYYVELEACEGFWINLLSTGERITARTLIVLKNLLNLPAQIKSKLLARESSYFKTAVAEISTGNQDLIEEAIVIADLEGDTISLGNAETVELRRRKRESSLLTPIQTPLVSQFYKEIEQSTEAQLSVKKNTSNSSDNVYANPLVEQNSINSFLLISNVFARKYTGKNYRQSTDLLSLDRIQQKKLYCVECSFKKAVKKMKATYSEGRRGRFNQRLI